MTGLGFAVFGQRNEVLQWTTGDNGTFMVYVDCNNTIWIYWIGVQNLKIEFVQGNGPGNNFPFYTCSLYNPRLNAYQKECPQNLNLNYKE